MYAKETRTALPQKGKFAYSSKVTLLSLGFSKFAM